jgi:DNA end-binding protein Ku
MAPRAAWKGYLKISLVSLPVQAYVASSSEDGGGIRLNQLHRECHSRIKHVKTCPIHGEVPNDEIVSGYEYAKDQYVEIDPGELKKLRPDGDRAIDVVTFVPPEAVDPAYSAGKTYYLLPDGKIGEKAYQLLCAAMEAEGVNAIGKMMITTKEHVVRLRPADGLLAVDLLEYAAGVRSPEAFKSEFQDDLVDTHPSVQETKLTRQLVSSMTEDTVDLTRFTDTYATQVKELIDAKVSGKEVVVSAPAEEAPVINLMDALRQSMAKSKKSATRPARRKAPSVTKRAAATSKPATRRRKSG